MVVIVKRKVKRRLTCKGRGLRATSARIKKRDRREINASSLIHITAIYTQLFVLCIIDD